MTVSPDFVTFILVALTTTRLTAVWLDDEFARPVRDPVFTFLGGRRGALASWLLWLLTCRWCVSVWIGSAVAAIAYYAHNSPIVIIAMMGLAASQVTGMIGDVGR